MKHQNLEETITEVIAGSLYKALLYDRSPIFRLCEEPDGTLSLKSNLLDGFIVLHKAVYEKVKEKTLSLIREKFADQDGQVELITHMAQFLYCAPVVLEKLIKNANEKIKGSEEFFVNIQEQFNELDNDLDSLTKVNSILAQVFEKFKSDKELIELKKCVEESLIDDKYIFYHINYGRHSASIGRKKEDFQHQLNQECNNFYQSEVLAKWVKETIRELAFFYKSLGTIADRFDREELNKEFLLEIIEEIKRAEGIGEEVMNRVSQELKREVGGLEKIITSMMLLGYNDLHSGNIGIVEIEHENRDGRKKKEKVYAKVDMSASFCNLGNTHHLDYLNELKFIVFNSRVARENKTNWHAAIDYSELKEEINKSCDLFIDKPEYVESLIYRALFYQLQPAKAGGLKKRF